MNLEPNPDQRALAEGAREFFAGEMSLAAMRERPRGAGPDPAIWRQAGELGWLSVGIGAEGGGGADAAAETLVGLELGALLSPGPFLATAAAARVAAAAEDAEALARLVDGEAWAGVAYRDEGVSLDADRLAGELTIFDAAGAAFAAVIDEAMPAIALIEPPDALREANVDSIDEATPVARGELDVPVRAYVEGPAAAAILDRATLSAAAMLAGAARGAGALAVGYAKVREQFGKPIGSFQAIAHRCADMAVRGEAAAALALHAALALDEAPDEAAELIAAAKAFAGAAAVDNATAAIQVHGAIGFTAEHDAHLYLKRARVLDALWGDRRSRLRRLVAAPELLMSMMREDVDDSQPDG